MATSLQTNHGLGYYAPSDITSWLNGFNPLVLKLETLLTNMDEVDQELRDDLTQGLADLNTEITNIKSSNTVQDSNILALQTAITNINNIITDIQDSISNINDRFTWKFYGNVAGDLTVQYSAINNNAWNELFIQVQYSGVFVSFSLPRIVIVGAGSKHWYGGSYFSTTVNVGAHLWTSNSEFNLATLQANGTAVTDKSKVTLTIYYK